MGDWSETNKERAALPLRAQILPDHFSDPLHTGFEPLHQKTPYRDHTCRACQNANLFHSCDRLKGSRVINHCLDTDESGVLVRFQDLALLLFRPYLRRRPTERGVLGSFTYRLDTEKSRDSLRADSLLSIECLAACDLGLGGCPTPPQAVPHKKPTCSGT